LWACRAALDPTRQTSVTQPSHFDRMTSVAAEPFGFGPPGQPSGPAKSGAIFSGIAAVTDIRMFALIFSASFVIAIVVLAIFGLRDGDSDSDWLSF